MSSGIINYPKFKAFDTNGAPLAGGLLYAYEMGTTTPKDTYTSVGLSVPNTNPVVLDSLGEAVVFGSGTYKLALADSDDVTIWTFDGVEFAAAGASKVSGADTTAGFLEDKLVAGANIALTKLNAGANETFRIAVTGIPADPLVDSDIGVSVQGYDALLAAIAGLTSVAGKSIRFTSVAAEAFVLTNFAKTLLDDADAASMRTTLGISGSTSEWEEITASKTTANNSANVAFTGLDETTYDYRVVIRDAKPGTTGATLRLETGYGAGPTYRASDYSVAITASDQGGTAANVASVDQTIAVISPALATATADRVRADLEFGWDGVDTVSGLGKVVYIGPNGGTNPAVKSGAFGMVNYTNGLSALRFTMSSGNIASGVFRLFRRAK